VLEQYERLGDKIGGYPPEYQPSALRSVMLSASLQRRVGHFGGSRRIQLSAARTLVVSAPMLQGVWYVFRFAYTLITSEVDA
jgi:hypothetical protein